MLNNINTERVGPHAPDNTFSTSAGLLGPKNHCHTHLLGQKKEAER